MNAIERIRRATERASKTEVEVIKANERHAKAKAELVEAIRQWEAKPVEQQA